MGLEIFRRYFGDIEGVMGDYRGELSLVLGGSFLRFPPLTLPLFLGIFLKAFTVFL